MTENSRSGDQFDSNFWDNPKLWDNYDKGGDLRSRLWWIVERIAPNEQRVLDIGCGRGDLLEILSGRAKAFGLDLSVEALRRCKSPVVKASATALPFGDKSLDIVCLTDLLEHLNDADHRRVLKEVDRVARHYIFVSVPWMERPAQARTKCFRCGTIFNADSHCRTTQSIQTMRVLITGWHLREHFLAGPAIQRPPSWVYWCYRHIGGIWAFWGQHLRCPECGNEDAPPPPCFSMRVWRKAWGAFCRIGIAFSKPKPSFFLGCYERASPL